MPEFSFGRVFGGNRHGSRLALVAIDIGLHLANAQLAILFEALFDLGENEIAAATRLVRQFCHAACLASRFGRFDLAQEFDRGRGIHTARQSDIGKEIASPRVAIRADYIVERVRKEERPMAQWNAVAFLAATHGAREPAQGDRVENLVLYQLAPDGVLPLR